MVLSNVDANDNTDILTSKELYVLENKKTGIKSNRHSEKSNRVDIVNFSLLDDIKEFKMYTQ